VRSQILASRPGAFMLTISKSAEPQFSLTMSYSTGAACADESTRHMLKRFRRIFLS